MPRVAGHGVGRARCRPIARAVGDVRGERARPEFRLEGAKAGLEGRRVRVRGADSLGRAGVGRGELGADEGVSAHIGARANKCYTCERDKNAIACSSRRPVQTSQVKSSKFESLK